MKKWWKGFRLSAAKKKSVKESTNAVNSITEKNRNIY